MFFSPSLIQVIKMLDIKIGNYSIDQVSVVKYLGVDIDKCLTWENHINKLLPSLRATLRLLYRLRSTVPFKFLKMLYFAYFHSHISYMALIWSTANQLDVHKIKVLQNSCIKCMLKVDRRFHTKQLFLMSNIIPFEVICQVQQSMVIMNHHNKIKLSNAPIITHSSIHVHNTRFARDFMLPKVKSTKYGLKAPYYKSLVLFNSLPSSLKSQILPNAKDKLKTHLLSLYYA